MKRIPLPTRSVALFLAGAAVLRVLFVAAWSAFPAHGGLQGIAHILIGLGCAFALVCLNRRFLLRDGLGAASLGLSPRRSPWFFAAGLLVMPALMLMVGTLWLLVPFHWESGTLASKDLGWLFAEYFGGNFGEELIFRGYLLLVLQRSVGLTRAMLAVSLLFGLFHLPGLSGTVAMKMVFTTAIWSFVFGLGFIRTGSLWTAIGMHVFGNMVLHRVIGMSGEESLLRMKLDAPWPAGYDPGLVACGAIIIPVALWLFLCRDRGA